MSDAQQYDITVRPNDPWNRAFYTTLADGTAQLYPGFTAVMVIYLEDDALFTSGGDTPDIVVTSQPGGEQNRFDVLVGQDVTGSLLVPYDSGTGFWYQLDLVDDADASNVIPLLFGKINVERKHGS